MAHFHRGQTAVFWRSVLVDTIKSSTETRELTLSALDGITTGNGAQKTRSIPKGSELRKVSAFKERQLKKRETVFCSPTANNIIH
jgi:hypothetical protein